MRIIEENYSQPSGKRWNNLLETIGIKNGVKLLILIEIHKNVFRAFPSD